MQTDEEVLAGWVRSHSPSSRSVGQRVSAARTRGAIMSGAGSVVVFITLQILTPSRPRRRAWATGQPRGLHTLAVALLSAGALLFVVAVAYAWTSGQGRADRRSPLLALTVRQRAQVRRQALGRQPALPADVPFLRIVAKRWSRRDHVLALSIGAAALCSGLAILSTQPLRTLAALMAASQAVTVVVLLRRTTLARAFLHDHPQPLEHPSH